MTFAQIFTLTAVPVVPLWLLMIFAPGWRWTVRIVSQPWSYVPLTVLYTVLVLTRLGDVIQAVVVNPRLESVAPLLATPAGATIAWVHLLAFDVFVGRWEYLDARARGIPALVMAPILALTFLFGPTGLLVYVLVSRLLRVGSPGPAQPPSPAQLPSPAQPAGHTPESATA